MEIIKVQNTIFKKITAVIPSGAMVVEINWKGSFLR